MKRNKDFYRPPCRSGVLVLTLLIMVLVSVVVLGLLTSATVEKQVSESTYEQRRALSFATLGFQAGVAQLRDGLGTGSESWDNPYANFCSNSPGFFWSVSPGLLTRWSYSQQQALANIPLFSLANTGITNLVNLNRPLSDGSYPIIGGASPPPVAVQFCNVLPNPSLPATASNAIIGRYAFWIDDESAKININVADGTEKYTAKSLGIGSPTEVSLQVLPQDSTPISQTEAQSIVSVARTTNFHSPREILRAAGTDTSLYTNNVFDITDYSRSPDLNVFGQPKMAIMPLLGDPDQYGSTMIINGITLRPEAGEIYPTPLQLPYVPMQGPDGATYYNPWPLAFHAEGPLYTMGRQMAFGNDVNLYAWNYYIPPNTYAYNNGEVLAHYMAGKNVLGQPVTWPAFTGASGNGFLGKYTPRQIDEIAIQITNLGSKLISSDYPNPLSTDFPTNNVLCLPSTEPSDDDFINGQMMYCSGARYDTSPFIFPGWLSGQWVIGTGRAPKVTGIGACFRTYGAMGTFGSASYKPAYLTMDLWLEEWIPGAYRGGDYTHPLLPIKPPELIGNREAQEQLNISDVEQAESGPPNVATLPKAGTTSPDSYWANQLLTDTDEGNANEGIDFNENLNSTNDPDPGLAAAYHPYDTNSQGSYNGSENYPTKTPFLMEPLVDVSVPELMEWPPGTVRCVTSQYGSLGPLYMKTNAGSTTMPTNQTLHIGGGISIQHNAISGSDSDYDPVPLEAIRGVGGNLTTDHYVDSISAPMISASSWLGTFGMTGSTPSYSSTTTVRDRHVASVIPLIDNTGPILTPLTLSIPAPGTLPGNSSNTNESKWVYAYPTDPLVNKFPGDWHVRIDTNSVIPAYWPEAPGNTNAYGESSLISSLSSGTGDPDSFWVPQMDCPYTYFTNIAPHTLIPRSARMPSVGYLQYTRTGIIPDNETIAYQSQQGVPYRLLSFAPAGDTAQLVHGNGYPDWALLDLLYVPSILDSYGGPYAGMTNLARFGTYGGATAGRINPNGSVIYTTNVSAPQPDVFRTLPLQATLYGLMINQSFTQDFTTAESLPYSGATNWPYSGGIALDSTPAATLAGAAVGFPSSATLAQAIAGFISTNGPLRMPAEICNISDISNLRAAENRLGTRNDLVRQMVGELTTQSDVFSVWTIGQVVQKVPGHKQYGDFEPGDQILGEVRLHLIVERFVDPGADGIVGDLNHSGPDNAVGSFDDPVDPNHSTTAYDPLSAHPYMPRYLYRVVRSEEVR